MAVWRGADVACRDCVMHAPWHGAFPSEQRSLFARQVYFRLSAELRAGGREYNDKASPRHGSYLRGRQAIAALFPGTTPGVYEGDVTLYGGQ